MWGSSSGAGPTDLSTPIGLSGASDRGSQVASTVNEIVLFHSNHRIQQTWPWSSPSSMRDIPRWKAQSLPTGSLTRSHGPYREESFHPSPDAHRTAGILLRLGSPRAPHVPSRRSKQSRPSGADPYPGNRARCSGRVCGRAGRGRSACSQTPSQCQRSGLCPMVWCKSASPRLSPDDQAVTADSLRTGSSLNALRLSSDM